jgi:hypothetical protein
VQGSGEAAGAHAPDGASGASGKPTKPKRGFPNLDELKNLRDGGSH